MPVLIVYGSLAWFLSGVIGSIYGWLHEDDMRVEHIPMALLWGFAGPVAWIVAVLKYNREHVLFQKWEEED